MATKWLTAEEKGKFAESMVVNMFQASGLRIYQNGIERTNADFYNDFDARKKKGEIKKYDERLRQLMSKSDYIVENRNGNYDFLEVKFRSTHHLPEVAEENLFFQLNLKKHFDSCNKFWKPYILLITSEPLADTGMFTVIVPPYYIRKKGVVELMCCSLESVEKWKINPVMIKNFEEIITQMLVNGN